MKRLTVGSLFSGIGGIDLGLERAGMRTRWFSEVDAYASRVLAKHWPDVPNHGDITQIDFRQVEPVDVLAGGFPCQDISNAGRREGIDGKRSGLWSEYARAIGELRPRYVFVENVAALLARGLDRVLGDLAALGYDAEWDCIPAAAVGAPHRRDRLYLVAYPCGQRAKQPIPIARSQSSPFVTGDGPAGYVADAHLTGLEGRERQVVCQRAGERITRAGGSPVAHTPVFRGHDGWRLESAEGGSRSRLARQWSTEPDVGRVADGVPARVDRLRGLGNAVVPQIPELIGGWIVEHARATAHQEAA